jgi:hypothetical protein
MARRIRKLDGGLYAVSLSVSEDVIRFALREAKRGGYLGPADYLNAVLNTAMLHAMKDQPLSPQEIESRKGLNAESDDGFAL